VPGYRGRGAAAGWLFAGLLSQAWGQGIFTCVDAKGRRLTADRPIAECTDREQRELTGQGLVKRRIGPTLTAEEQMAVAEKERAQIDERNRLAEEKKRERALLTRYPNIAAHDKERATALALEDELIATARKRTVELQAERRRLDLEVEFFKADPSKVPPKLKRQFEENASNTDAQARFVARHEGERKRINARFDQELVKLKQLWAQAAQPAGGAVPAAARR
jgi:hypothetical protein